MDVSFLSTDIYFILGVSKLKSSFHRVFYQLTIYFFMCRFIYGMVHVY